MRTSWTLSWKKQLTLYAILVRGLDLCQDYLGGERPEDGQPKDDYDIGPKRRTRRCCPPLLKLTCVPKKPVPIPDLTLPYLRHVEYADAEADVVKDAIRVFLVQFIDEGLFWGETELRGVYGDLVLLCEKLLRERDMEERKEKVC